MKTSVVPLVRTGIPLAAGLLLLCQAGAWATDWPQYRGPTTDGISPDLISTSWPTAGPSVVWTNGSLTNGFSCLAVSGGRTFTLISKLDGGTLREYCVAVDAATGTNLWATPIDVAPWNPASSSSSDGGAGKSPCDTGDGPRTTPSVCAGRVLALSGQMKLVCLNATNGSVIWSNNLVSSYEASYPSYDNGASPCLDNDLVFVSLNTSTNSQNLVAFRTADGGMAWSSQDENASQATPVVATIAGVRQVIFPTTTGLVALDRTTGAYLWKYNYPFGGISWMGASPVVYSNIVYYTVGYSKGAGAVRITVTNSTWTATQLYFTNSDSYSYRSIWMTPVCYQGYVYSLCGDTSYTNAPLRCIELSTGTLKWSTNNFGQGGLILVNTNLLVLTGDGQLVLVRPNPSAYTELARYRAFQFSASAHGKCWNNPTFSNGRIYARSTRGSIALDVSVTTPPPLKLLAPQFLSSTQLQLMVATEDGTPIASNRLPKIEVRVTNALGSSPATWPRLTNQLVLATNGVARLTNTISTGQDRQFYRTVEQP